MASVSEATPGEVATTRKPLTGARRWAGWLVRLCCWAALAFLGWHVYHVHLATNFHTVLNGRLYRSAQLSDDQLKTMVKRHDIRTVINLRGLCTGVDWYEKQCAAVQDLGITQEDLCFSANRLPSAREIQRLIEVLDRAEPPFLVHCRQGADRTGLVSVVARLLYSRDGVTRARRHLLPRYGHFPVGNTAYMDEFFDLYEEWLTHKSAEHTPEKFRHWAQHEYRGGWCNQKFESIVFSGRLRARATASLNVRIRNDSERTWHFRPLARAGMHLMMYWYDERNQIACVARAGQFYKDLPGGEAIDLTFFIDTLPKAGRYRMVLDMLEEGHAHFQQIGADSWEQEIVVHE